MIEMCRLFVGCGNLCDVRDHIIHLFYLWHLSSARKYSSEKRKNVGKRKLSSIRDSFFFKNFLENSSSFYVGCVAMRLEGGGGEYLMRKRTIYGKRSDEVVHLHPRGDGFVCG